MTYVPFNNADIIADRFLALLSKLGVKPPTGSVIEDELLSTFRLVEVIKHPDQAQGGDAPRILRHAAGLHDLAAKILAAEPLPDFNQFEAHIRLLGAGARTSDTVLQNTKSPLANDTNRKITELYLACLAVHLGQGIKLDAPSGGKGGDNPDIIFNPDEDPGRIWTLAIKSISGQSGQTYFERIREAAHQIDAPACSADVGMVVINIQNILDHDALWNTDFPTEQDACAALMAQIQNVIDKANKDRLKEEWDELFQGKVVRPILFLAQSVARVKTPAGPEMPTALKMICMFDAQGALNPKARKIAFIMNHMMQTILAGKPGAPDVQPS